MKAPKIEIIPSRAATCSDSGVVLDVLVRITPPTPEVHFPRPPMNLALVLDRSGSMAGAKKMPYALQAASFVVEQLLPTDRVSVFSFDSVVETVVPNTLAVDKPGIIRRMAGIAPRGGTDLQGGWGAGAAEVGKAPAAGGLNRVLLLSDGQANEGITDPNAIAANVKTVAGLGVGTTTLGVGADYNEDLLEAMARAGNGNYYYIESPVQLFDIFQSELQGLMGTQGQRVSLGVEVGPGASLSEVLNDFEKATTGRLMLPNLTVRMPISVIIRLNVPAQPGPIAPLSVRLAWDDPEGLGRRTATAGLEALPAVPMAEWSGLPVDLQVSEQVALLNAARSQKEASRAHEAGDYASTIRHLGEALAGLGGHPTSSTLSEEICATQGMMDSFQVGNDLHARKLAKFRSYQRSSSRSAPVPDPDEPGPTQA